MPAPHPLARRSRGRTWLVAHSRPAGRRLLAAGGAALYYYADTLIERHLRPATIALLEDRFESAVELSSLKVSMVPALSIRGRGSEAAQEGARPISRRSSPFARSRFPADVRELWERRIDRVHLEGLEIVVPPRRGADMPGADGRRSDGGQPASSARRRTPDAFIKELVTEDSLLTIMSKQEGKAAARVSAPQDPVREFPVQPAVRVRGRSQQPDAEGDIAVVGSFGPVAGR